MPVTTTEKSLRDHIMEMKSDLSEVKANTETYLARLNDHSKRIRLLEWYAGVITGFLILLKVIRG